MNAIELKKAIKKARAIYVNVIVNRDCTANFKITKTEALYQSDNAGTNNIGADLDENNDLYIDACYSEY